MDLKDALISTLNHNNLKFNESGIDDYLKFVSSRSSELTEGTNVHHIIPRCLYDKRANQGMLDEFKISEEELSSWESGNLVRLSIEDHIEAHRILSECVDSYKLDCAYYGIVSYNFNYLVSIDKEDYLLNLKEERKKQFIDNMHSDKAKEKSRSTNLERYGSEYFPNCHSEDAIDKRNSTYLSKYGSKAPNLDKRFETNLNKYGYSVAANANKEAQERSRKVREEKYGKFSDFMHSKEISEKRLSTIEKKFGSKVGQMKTKEALEKRSRTMSRPVYQIDFNGNIVKEFDRIGHVVTPNGASRSTIQGYVQREVPYQGFYWIKKERYNQWLKENPNLFNDYK